MTSSMSGWATSSTTILAARRVTPPDRIVPAEASAPRMNDTGPEAVPPADTCSLEDLKDERLTPEPDPPLKINPSSRYQFKIESTNSSLDKIKQPDTCCSLHVTTFNHTGELNVQSGCKRQSA